MRLRSGIVAAACLLALARQAAAQPVADAERQLLPFRHNVLRGLPESFWAGLAFVRTEEDRQRSLRADVTFGISGDETDSRSLFKLNTGIGLARASFPSEVTVVNRLALQLRDGDVQEDVTSLQISYDYHAASALEYFAFAERFADNFLSIQQRYEIGFGVRTGLTLGHIDPWTATMAQFTAVRQQRQAIDDAFRARDEGDALRQPGPTADDLQRLDTALGYLRDSFTERQSRLFLGLAVSAFAEVERAELDLVRSPVDGGEGTAVKVSLPGTHRYRISVRPTLRLRPTHDILLTVLPYYKLPLEGPRRVVRDGQRRLDYRRDLFSEMVWTIRGATSGVESVDLVATLSHFYDNVPPALPASVVADAATARVRYNRTIADESHRLATIALRLRW